MSDFATLSKWGNSQGIRLPKAFCDQLDLSVGDKVSLSLKEKCIVMTKAEERFTLRARMGSWNGKPLEAKEYDWGSPVGEELW